LSGAVLIFLPSCFYIAERIFRTHYMQLKKKTALLVTLAAMLILGACHSEQNPTTEVAGMKIPNILPKDTVKGTPGEQMNIHSTFDKAIAALKANNDNPKPLLDLAAAYILEGRISGNGGYYSNAALTVLNKVLDGETTTEDQRFQALILKSTVLLNMHQFAQALDVANQGLAIAQYNAGIWGCIVDANVELGHYDEAVKACDKMVSIRPDLRSYSRVSYLRQIYGDNRGAIDAMKMATESGVPGLESTEWARVQLGDLYLNTGNADSARLLYRYSLVYRPNYPYAEMGMARADKAQKNYDSAIEHARAAVKALPESSFIAFLADLYELKGDAQKAADMRADVQRLLKEAADNEPKNALVKHNGAREMALAYLATKDYDKALPYAKQDYDMRPDNIDANELMAWLSYLKGDYNAAKGYAEKNLVTHSKNAAMLYKDGLIFAAAGDANRGEMLKKEALSIMPYIDPRILAGGK
jgi:tetratricopeptide (TPR) repeat protein